MIVEYKEYAEEGLDASLLHAGFMPAEDYEKAHRGLTLFCHDVFVEYDDKILLVVRKNEPARDAIWPLGGRVIRGMSVEESAARKVWEESNLRVKDLRLLGFCRTYFQTDPFGHGGGTDTINAVFYGKGEGSLQLDKLHDQPLLIDPNAYPPGFIQNLSPYVKDHLAIIAKFFKNKIHKNGFNFE